MSIFTFGSGNEVTLDQICDLSFNNYDRINTKFTNFDNKKPTAILHRFKDCVLSGNLLRDNYGTMACDGIATRPDMYHFHSPHKRTPIVNTITDETFNDAIQNKIKFGFLFRTLRDTSYPMFVCSCVPLFWYLKKILDNSNLKNGKVSIIISGESGGWEHPLYCMGSILQSKYINKIKKEKNISWKEIHTELANNTIIGKKIKQHVIDNIINWKNKNNYKHPIEKLEVGFDLCYIVEIITLLCEEYNIEIIEQDRDLAFEYLFVPAALSANFCNIFPKLTPSVQNVFSQLRDTCLQKNIKIDNKISGRCYITRFDKMYGLSQKNTGGGERIFTNETEINKILSNMNFTPINASYYNTIEKYHLFNAFKIFILFEGGGITNMMFFPENSIIIIICNGGWNNMTKRTNENWWITWNKQHYGFLNHEIYLYENVNIIRNNSPSDIISKITDLNHFENYLSNILK
jgi:hypothetical protein